MNNKLKEKRIELCYTQTELAEKAQLSLRTIQRIESGTTIPKGHTLKAITSALELELSDLSEQSDLSEHSTTEVNVKTKIQLINVSVLIFCYLPVVSLLIPAIIWSVNKRKDDTINETGRQILNFQIIWSVIYILAVIVSPFIQNAVDTDYPLILLTILFFVCANLFVIGKSAFLISKETFNVFPNSLRLI